MGVKQDMEELAELFKAVFEPRRKARKPISHKSCRYRTKTYKVRLDGSEAAESIYTGDSGLSFEGATRCIEDFNSYGGSGYE